MKGISIEQIIPKFINNTEYSDENILVVVQVAMTMASIDIGKAPLTVVSTFKNVPGKLGYYYTPAQLRRDKIDGRFTMDDKEFERAKYGIVRLKLNFLMEARGFLTTAIHEYIHAVQYEEEPEIMKIIGEDPMVVEAKEQIAYKRAKIFTEIACRKAWVIEALSKLDEELTAI